MTDVVIPSELDSPRGLHEGGVLLVSAVDLTEVFAPGAPPDCGPDFYHLNFANDAPLPVARILSDARIKWIDLKHSQGTSYGDWAPHQAAAVRDSRAALGAYHMLSGTDGTGTEQWRYFRTKYKPTAGDVVPAVDFESSGRGSASIADYRAKLIDFVKAAHVEGVEVVLYGHADVKAAFGDWRDSGADYWWVPGDQPHNDVGPRGPDLWQYSPYTSPDNYPTDPLGNGQRADVSVVLTALPLIGGPKEDEDVTIKEGWDFRKDQKSADPVPPDGKDPLFYLGWHAQDRLMALEVVKAPSSGVSPADLRSAIRAHDNDQDAHAPLDSHHHPGRIAVRNKTT